MVEIGLVTNTCGKGLPVKMSRADRLILTCQGYQVKVSQLSFAPQSQDQDIDPPIRQVQDRNIQLSEEDSRRFLFLRGDAMFCGKCGVQNDQRNKFCASCGTALQIVQSISNDLVDIVLPKLEEERKRYEATKIVMDLRSLSWEQARHLVGSAPVVLLEKKDPLLVRELKQKFLSLGIELDARPHGDIQEIGRPLQMRPLEAVSQVIRGKGNRINHPKWWIFFGLVVFTLWGSLRIYYGGDIGLRVVSKESFSFKDTIVNINDIVGMPRIAVAANHPQVKRQLERMGITETDEQATDRVWKDTEEKAHKLIRDYSF